MWIWMAAALMLLPCVAIAAPAPIPSPMLRQPAPPHLGDGWGLRVTQHGRSLDLSALGSGWANDGTTTNKDFELGFEWRKGNTGAVVGYTQMGEGDSIAVSRPGAPSRGAPGVLGVSLSFHR